MKEKEEIRSSLTTLRMYWEVLIMLNKNIIIYVEDIVRSCAEMTSGGNVAPAIDMLGEALRRLLNENIEEQWVRDSIEKVNMLYSACKLLTHPNVDTIMFSDIVFRLTSDTIDYNELNKLITLAQARIRAYSVK